VFTELIEEIGVKDCQVEELYVLDQENLQRLKYVSTQITRIIKRILLQMEW
jgi:hypothetical protein